MCFKRILSLIIIPILTLYVSFAHGQDAKPGAVELDISKQPLSSAIKQVANEFGLQIAFYSEVTDGMESPELKGTYTANEALDVLLEKTPLEHKYVDAKAVAITLKPESEGSEAGKSRPASNKTLVAQAETSAEKSGTTKKSTGSEVKEEGSGGMLEEIIVTADKRSTGKSIQDIALSIVAVSGDEIDKYNVIGMEDYLATIPGVSFSEQGEGTNQIRMRGIAGSSNEEASVGVYLGEVPLNLIGLSSAVDVKLVDINRVEILRGPQGTLFGSGGMSGAVRNIPNTPDLEEFGGKIEVGISNTEGAGGDMNNQVIGVVNIPLVKDELALRIAGYRFDNEGFTESVSASDPVYSAAAAAFGALVVNDKGIGDTEFLGIRASLLWKPNDDLSITLMHLTQDLEQDGITEINIPSGGYRGLAFDANGHFGGEGIIFDSDITNLLIEYDMGWGRFLSTTTYRKDTNDIVQDLGRFTFLPLPQLTQNDFDGVVQEVRFESQIESPFQIMAGFYYEDLDSRSDATTAWSGDPALSPFGITGLLDIRRERDIEQKAVFGEVTYEPIEQLTLTLGGRWFEYDRREFLDATGVLTASFLDETSKENGTHGKVNIAYRLNEDSLVYAQWAQGFRLGKPVSIPPTALCDTDNDGILDGTSTPINTSGLDSDELDNYELGGKLALLDNRLEINAALYRIKWEKIPVNVLSLTCFQSTEVNAGEAVSKGFEIEAHYRVTDNLRLNIGTSYNNSELSEDVPGLGLDGDRLPFSPKYNANIGFDYDFVVAGYDSYIRTNYAYVSSFHNDLQETSEKMGNYDKLSIGAGIFIDDWNIEIYGDNLTGSDELTFAGTVSGYRITPRRIGLNIGYRF